MNSGLELWSLQESRVYLPENATLKIHKGVTILCSPEGEPLVVKKR